jgi:hypothetical protein
VFASPSRSVASLLGGRQVVDAVGIDERRVGDERATSRRDRAADDDVELEETVDRRR